MLAFNLTKVLEPNVTLGHQFSPGVVHVPLQISVGADYFAFVTISVLMLLLIVVFLASYTIFFLWVSKVTLAQAPCRSSSFRATWTCPKPGSLRSS